MPMAGPNGVWNQNLISDDKTPLLRRCLNLANTVPVTVGEVERWNSPTFCPDWLTREMLHMQPLF